MQDADAIAKAERKAPSLGFQAADCAFCAANSISSDILYLQGAPHCSEGVLICEGDPECMSICTAACRMQMQSQRQIGRLQASAS